MNKGLVYTCVSIVAAIAFVAIASVVLPHFEKDTPFHTYYEVHNTGISCDGDRQDILSDISVVLDFDFDTIYPLSSKVNLPNKETLDSTAIFIYSDTDVEAVHCYSGVNNNAYEVSAVFVYEDCVAISTWRFIGASKVTVESLGSMVYIDLKLSTSVNYSVKSEGNTGHFVVTYPNEGSYGPTADHRFFVTTKVPGTFGLVPPEGKLFVYWADNPVPSKATAVYSPNEPITTSLTLYAIWGYNIYSHGETMGGGYTDKLEDITIDLWNGTTTDAKSRIGDTRSYTSSSIVFTPGDDCLQMDYSQQTSQSKHIVTVKYRFADAIVELSFAFDGFRNVQVVKSDRDHSLSVFLVLESNASFTSVCTANHVYG